MSKVLIQGDWLDGFSSGKKAALLDWSFRREQRDFDKLVQRLRVRKWQKEHPAQKAASQKRYNDKPSSRAKMLACQKAARRRRQRAAPTLFTCERCGVQWCKAPWTRGLRPRFCGDNCYAVHRYQHDSVFREAAKKSSRAQHAKKRAAR